MMIVETGDIVFQVDVLYPASPLFVWWDYNSVQLLMKPILEYAINDSFIDGRYTPYNLPWAPHHLGHWPGIVESYPVVQSLDIAFFDDNINVQCVIFKLVDKNRCQLKNPGTW